MTSKQDTPENTVRYTVGFVLSLFSTAIAYLIVVHGIFVGWQLTGSIVALAVIQLLVQVIFFLHLGSKNKPKTNAVFLASTCIVVVILVFGTIWIMNNLNHNMMSPSEANEYIIKDELLTK